MDEKRKFIRVNSKFPARYVNLSSSEQSNPLNDSGIGVNISSHGMLLSTFNELENDSLLKINLKLPYSDELSETNFMGKVKWKDKHLKNYHEKDLDSFDYFYGIEFLPMSSCLKLDDYINKFSILFDS